MAASLTVPYSVQFDNLIRISPRHGVVTLYGYGIAVRVDRGHLTLEDGVGPNRRFSRFARVCHRLKRVVVIGSSGHVSFEALRWLTDQDISFVMLERNGKVLATTGPVSPSDVRLRRAQATAHLSGIALPIARELIDKKLAGQAHLLKTHFPNYTATDGVTGARARLAKARSNEEIRACEAQGAQLYWAAWRELPVSFPRSDLPRVPDHWRTFGSRMSPLTMSPRLAVNPSQAMLNFLYSLLEAEARLALAALGLDPGLGVLHNDLRSRDSLACDLMEPVRTQADAVLRDWLVRSPLKREWFFERRDGNCRLMAPLAAKLAESSQVWKAAVAPFAEGIARALWSHARDGRNSEVLSTPLTQIRKRQARGSVVGIKQKTPLVRENVCTTCGASIESEYKHCRECAATKPKNVLTTVEIRRQVPHGLGGRARDPIAQARRAEAQRRQNFALKAWNPQSLPTCFDEKFYRQNVQQRLGSIQVQSIQSELSISEPYALRIRAGKCIPHPRHWIALARLGGFAPRINGRLKESYR